jgi:hypothetical protein
MQFTEKLTEADLANVRNMTRSRTYWLNMLLWGAGMILFTRRGWIVTAKVLDRTPSAWPTATALWGAAAAVILWALYNQHRIRSRRLAELNAARPDQMSLTTDGLKCDGPKGAIALIPWKHFKGWNEGPRVILVERTEGNRFVILPVAQLSEIERTPIRQFLQSHIAPLSQ